MKLTSILLFAIGAIAHDGWKIPKELPEGVFRVDSHPDGGFNFTQLANTPLHTQPRKINIAREPVTRFNRDKRLLQLPEFVTCLDYTLAAADNNDAFASLQHVCSGAEGTGIFPLGTFAHFGDVVVYWCNYSNLPICAPQDASFSIQQLLSRSCGAFVAGWTTWVGQAYGQESISNDPNFCGNGIGSQ